MIYVEELAAGDHVLGWMKTGFALQKKRAATGEVCFVVPERATRFRNSDITKFTGLVVGNDPDRRVLRLEVSYRNRFMVPTAPALPVEVPYDTLKVLRRVSPYSFKPREENPRWPTWKGLGTGFYPYRTQEEVRIK